MMSYSVYGSTLFNHFSTGTDFTSHVNPRTEGFKVYNNYIHIHSHAEHMYSNELTKTLMMILNNRKIVQRCKG